MTVTTTAAAKANLTIKTVKEINTSLFKTEVAREVTTPQSNPNINPNKWPRHIHIHWSVPTLFIVLSLHLYQSQFKDAVMLSKCECYIFVWFVLMNLIDTYFCHKSLTKRLLICLLLSISEHPLSALFKIFNNEISAIINKIREAR